MKWIIYFGMVFFSGFILSGCQHQSSNIHKITFKDPAHQPKSWDKTLLPPPEPSINEDKVAALNKTNYINGLPGALPDVSTLYTVTINLSKGDAVRWTPEGYHLAFFDRSTSKEEPVQVINGEKQGHFLVFHSVPSASKEHLDLFGLGPAPDYGKNNYLALYTNDTLVKQHEVNFVMGHAMGVLHTMTDLNGQKLEQGKDFDEVAGSWFTVKTGEWTQIRETDPNNPNQNHLVFAFKIGKE